MMQADCQDVSYEIYAKALRAGNFKELGEHSRLCVY